MPHFFRLFAATAVSILPFALFAGKVPDSVQSIHVYVLDDAGVRGRIVQEGERRASDIFRQAGIDILWTDCTVGKGLDKNSNCARPAYPDNLVIRILPKAASAARTVLGMAMQGDDGRGAYIDIFYDRIEALNQSYPVSAADILGSVMAHELGHLLLGKNSHSAWGIMQAKWELGDLREMTMGRANFSSQEAARIRETLLSLSVHGDDGRTKLAAMAGTD